MKVKPMIFNTEMVRALMDGRKVQTRRPVKPQPAPFKNWKGWIVESSNRKHEGCASWADGEEGSLRFNPVYAMPPCKVGDLIYVRETFRLLDSNDQCDCEYPCNHPQQGYPVYFADDQNSEWKWKPSIHMPRRASRLTLKVTGVRVERVQDISKADAEAEGFKLPPVDGQDFSIGAKTNFRHAWEKIYGDSWERNDWVWVIDFEVIRQNVDDYLKAQERAA